MNPSPNLFLIGPMGAGKSRIGRHLAHHFGMQCIDLDTAIEAHTGASVATIFEIEGEAGFRRRESDRLAAVVARRGIVLATGGGTILASTNRTLLRERGFVVWLQVSVAQQLRRLARDRQRPLLQGPDRRTRLEELAREREPLYGDVADLAFASADEPCAPAAIRVAALLAEHWQRPPSSGAGP